MSSLTTNFDEVLTRIQHGREFGHASFEPIYYLIFHPRQILEVKRCMPAWTARLRNDGWEVHPFSMAEAIDGVLANAPQRKYWLLGDRHNPLAWDRTNAALTNALNQGALVERLGALLEQQTGKPKAIVLVTDLEALHPYMRIGAIEGSLAGKFCAPTLFLYPGERTGKTKLKFLGFYPEDGNYRSVHVGG